MQKIKEDTGDKAVDEAKRFFYEQRKALATETKEASSTASSGTVSTSTMKLMIDEKDSSKNSESTLHGPAPAHRSRWRLEVLQEVFEVWCKSRLRFQVC